MEGIPEINYRDDTFTFVTDDLRVAYDGLVKAVGMARVGYVNVLQEVLLNRPEATKSSPRMAKHWSNVGSIKNRGATSDRMRALQRQPPVNVFTDSGKA